MKHFQFFLFKKKVRQLQGEVWILFLVMQESSTLAQFYQKKTIKYGSWNLYSVIFAWLLSIYQSDFPMFVWEYWDHQYEVLTNFKSAINSQSCWKISGLLHRLIGSLWYSYWYILVHNFLEPGFETKKVVAYVHIKRCFKLERYDITTIFWDWIYIIFKISGSTLWSLQWILLRWFSLQLSNWCYICWVIALRRSSWKSLQKLPPLWIRRYLDMVRFMFLFIVILLVFLWAMIPHSIKDFMLASWHSLFYCST